MNYSVLEKSALFTGLSSSELKLLLKDAPYSIRHYDKGDIIFRLMEPASKIGIILKGHAEAQKPFPNGSQINVSVRMPGELIGPAAAFSKSRRYPCDIVALDGVEVMMFEKKDLLMFLQQHVRISENFIALIATSTFMLQQRLELLSYNGIAQKAAFWLLIRARELGSDQIPVPGSITNWALQMNVSRPSLHRELKHLQDQNIIEYTSPVIKILDKDRLQDVLSH